MCQQKNVYNKGVALKQKKTGITSL